MSRKESYEQRTEELLLPIIEEFHFELVDVEYVKEGGNWYLRAYIDKEGGITVDDCEVVSRRMSDLLDEQDFIEESYIFEVSSPGLGRPLKKEKDYARSIGKELEIRTYRAMSKKQDNNSETPSGHPSMPKKQGNISGTPSGHPSMSKKQDNNSKEFYGILKSYDETTVTIELEDHTEMTFAKSDIALIRLAFDF